MPPEKEGGESGEDQSGTVRFQKVSDEDFARMSKNFPEGGKTSKGTGLRRRKSRTNDKEEFLPSSETVAKSNILKHVFFEKHTLVASDPKKYQSELIACRGAIESKVLSGDMRKKIKKLNMQFLVIRDQRPPPRDRRMSSPPAPAPAPRSLSLEEILFREKSMIPRVVRQALDFMSKEEMLNTEGLFRVAGNSYEIDMLWESLAEGESIPATCDVHTVTSVFKRFFRELKEPLFTFKLHKKFLHAVNDDLTEAETIKKLKETLGEVPEINRRIIRELFDFLNNVMAHSKSNMMHAVNLGIVFGPSLLRDDSSMGAMFDNRNQVVTTILENYSSIFDIPGTAE